MISFKNPLFFALLQVLFISSMFAEVMLETDEYDAILSKQSNRIEVIYPNNTVEFGKELTPLQVKEEPAVNWESDDKTYYTLMMIDPDAPSRQDPKFRSVKHWMVVNVLGNDVKNGEIIAEYMGSGPPKGTGLHRYIFLVYKQSKKINFDEPKSGKYSRAHRLSFNFADFLKKYSLTELDFVNYYVAQWDEYVEERNKNITNN